jgi:hypothetical protein
MDAEQFCRFLPPTSTHRYALTSNLFPALAQKVRITSLGEAEEARFKFHWQERDGPPVVVPTRKGFGSILLEKLASQDFGAQPKITFALHGLSYLIDASLPAMTAGNQRTNLLRSSDYSRP